MSILRRLERGIFHLLGPAQITRPDEEPKHGPAVSHETMPPGYERRGTPGNYYLVRTDDPAPELPQ